MFNYLKKFKQVVISSLTVMMAFVLLLATIELAWIICKDVVSPPYFLLEIDELLEIFGLFMLVIIGVELLETIMKTYLTEEVNHAEIVISVAIIAIARKVIILDVNDESSTTLLGIGVVILALTIGYFLVRYKRNGKIDAA
ncbi:MAG TPA: phosphate-starvation-inducible E-like protein [Desulfobulbaceae bacterium]|nr:phosphate-starvation-inducible E-like protein [Desulfobulbaceae bacterium]